jgi:hypothetical protein
MSRRREREPPVCVWVTPPVPDLVCTVCTEVFTDPVALACGHAFCRACAVRWFDSPAKRCPVARCPASAGSTPAVLPAAYALKSMVEALRVHCRFGVVDDGRAGWTAGPEGCAAQLSRADAAAHEAACEHALEVCPFAGCGVQRRRRDADAHDAAAALAHARGERDARLALEARVRGEPAVRSDALETSALGERDARLDALEASSRAQQARLDALETRSAALVPAVPVRQPRLAPLMPVNPIVDAIWDAAAARQARVDAVVPAAGGSSGGIARSVTVAVRRGTPNAHGGNSVVACEWSPDGSKLISGANDGLLKLWDVPTLECTATLAGHEGVIKDCVWSLDGRTLASASTDSTLKLWSVETRTCLTTLNAASAFYSCAFSPDGRSLASTGIGFKVWDVATGSCTSALGGSSYWCCAWNHDGTRLLVGGEVCAKLWDVAASSCIATLVGHTSSVNACAWSPDGQSCMTGSSDHKLKLWSAVAPFNCTATLQGHQNAIEACAWCPDGRTSMSASYDKTTKLWDAATGNCCATLQCGSPVLTSCWSPNGDMLAVGCQDGSLVLYDVQRA